MQLFHRAPTPPSRHALASTPRGPPLSGLPPPGTPPPSRLGRAWSPRAGRLAVGRGLAAGPRAPRVAHSRDPGLLLSGVFRRKGEPRRGRPGPGGGPGAPDSARRGPLRLALGPPTPPAGLRETERAPVLRRPEAGVLASAAGRTHPGTRWALSSPGSACGTLGDPGWPAEPAPAKVPERFYCARLGDRMNE